MIRFLILVWFVATFWPLLVLAAAVGGLVYVVRSMLDTAAGQRELARRRQAAIAARCDAENAAVVAGDNRGVYGQFPEERL
jgi:hypothetical protein